MARLLKAVFYFCREVNERSVSVVQVQDDTIFVTNEKVRQYKVNRIQGIVPFSNLHILVLNEGRLNVNIGINTALPHSRH